MFRFSERFIHEFNSQGYTVLPGILPPALIRDLRRASSRVHEIARQRSGPQAQRLQPIEDFGLDMRPFQAYKDLPALTDALHRILSPRHSTASFGSPLGGLGILIEPAEQADCTPWHRDIAHHTSNDEILDYWRSHLTDANVFNQINCALYADDSTWFVPGSHLRDDLECERAAFDAFPPKPPRFHDLDAESREATALAYCRRMPGAVRVCLDPGDLALYRNTLWHLGNYVPYRKRATLHDSPRTPEYNTFLERFTQLQNEALAASNR